MASDNRPLSPHLQVYRLPLTAILSIAHRLTGLLVGFGALLLVALLFSLAAGESAYAVLQGLAASWFGRTLLVLLTLALYFHFCNGIRHLFWDAGYGFDLTTADRSGWAALGGALVLTAVTWIVAAQ